MELGDERGALHIGQQTHDPGYNWSQDGILAQPILVVHGESYRHDQYSTVEGSSYDFIETNSKHMIVYLITRADYSCEPCGADDWLINVNIAHGLMLRTL